MAISEKTSVVVDFEDLLLADSKLAESLVKTPDEYLEHANRAALTQLQIEAPVYASEVEVVNHLEYQGAIAQRGTGQAEAAPLVVYQPSLGTRSIYPA